MSRVKGHMGLASLRLAQGKGNTQKAHIPEKSRPPRPGAESEVLFCRMSELQGPD